MLKFLVWLVLLFVGSAAIALIPGSVALHLVAGMLWGAIITFGVLLA